PPPRSSPFPYTTLFRSICLFARGHALLMGVPGLAKTLLVRKLAETMSLKFSRIQFTPDLMPMDITGTDILQDQAGGRREFEFVRSEEHTSELQSLAYLV